MDEKLLKNSEGVGRKNRRDPLTGNIPAIYVPGDFRNTYKILGICGIDRRMPVPIYHKIHTGNNDSLEYADFVDDAITAGYIFPHDIIVSDNASYHVGGENKHLEDYLWEEYKILLVYLPARTPEWNPIEKIWNVLVKRLTCVSLIELKMLGANAIAKAAGSILNQVSFKTVDDCYIKSYKV